jgi:hypothetical protein
VELGLYGKRIEARTLREMTDVLGRLEGVVPPDVRSRIREEGSKVDVIHTNESAGNGDVDMGLDEGVSEAS